MSILHILNFSWNSCSTFFWKHSEYRDPTEVARRAQDRASAKMKRQQGGAVPEWGEEDESYSFGRGGKKYKTNKKGKKVEEEEEEEREDAYYKQVKSKISGDKRKRKEGYDWGKLCYPKK